MKIKLDNVAQLGFKQIIKGIAHCYDNSNSLFKSALILKRNKKFAPGSSLLILSIEELIKALSLFYSLILDEDINEDTLLKELFDSRDLHGTRLEFALYISNFLKSLNIKQIRKAKIENPEDLSNAILLNMDISILNKAVIKDRRLLNNWFKQANQRKNMGFYVSLNSKQWITPEKIDEKEFQLALEETKMIRKMLMLLFDNFLKEDEDFQLLSIQFWKEMGKDFEFKVN